MSRNPSSTHKSIDDEELVRMEARKRSRNSPGGVAKVLGCLALLLLPWMAFFPMLGSDLSFSEADFVVRGDDGRDLTLREIWSFQRIISGNPVAATLNRWQGDLPGDSAAWGHRINLLIHGFNAVLLWWVLRLGGIRVAFVTALFWAVHPAVFQPLYWPGYRSLLLGMSALLIPLGLVLGARQRWRHGAAMIAAFCGPMVHPVALLLPLVYFCFRIRHVRRDGTRAFNGVLPYGLIAIACGVMITQVQVETLAEERRAQVDVEPEISVETMPLAYVSDQVKYAFRRAYLPFENRLFSRFQARPEEGARTVPGEDLVPILFLLTPLILIIGQWQHRWARNLATAWFLMVLFLAFFLFHPGAGPGGERAHEDAYLYFLLPVAIGWALGVGRLLVARVESKGTTLHALAALCVFAPLPFISIFAASKVASEVDAWTSVRASFPGSWAARLGYVRAHLASDDSEVTFEELQESLLSILRARPDLVELRRNLLELYREAGRLESADREVRRLLSENPRDVDLLLLLAELNQELERELEVVTAHERILVLEPDNENSLRTLGAIHQRNRRNDQAVRMFERLHRLDADDTAIAADLMRTYRLLGQVDEARRIHDAFEAGRIPVEAEIELAFLDAPFNPEVAKRRLRTLAADYSLTPAAKSRIVRFIASMAEVAPSDAEFIRDLAREAVMASDESDANLQYTLGIALSLAGDHVQAQRAFRQARTRAVDERNLLLREQIDAALRFAEEARRVEGSWE